jgi:dUTP pyrophosphatase
LYRQFRKDEDYAAPARQHSGDAGFDLAISRYTQISPGQNAHLPTNIAVSIPVGSFGLILPRSSTLWRKGLHVSPGVIDSGYRGEVMVVVRNITDRSTHVDVGQRVAQLFILPAWPGRFVLVDEMPKGDRGDEGFGSTGDMVIWAALPLLSIARAIL